MLVVVVTGMSGAGKSTALRALEDLGFYCVDNLPPPLVGATLEALGRGRVDRIALGLDVRVRELMGNIGNVIESIASEARERAVLFLDASDEALLKRFSGTRRPHPLSTLGTGGAALAVLEGVRLERERLSSLRAMATLVIDTTRLSVHDLRRRILADFGPGAGSGPRMLTRFVSFGFKYGSPVDADLVFDVRFLKNPYFVEELSAHPGTAPEVRDYVMADSETAQLLERLERLLEYCIPRFEREGKAYLTVAFGCTGGRHRSVVVAEAAAAAIQQRLGFELEVVHRDLDRAGREEQRSDPDWIEPRRGGPGS
jgi:RNase adapter protein RapZ